MTEDPYAMASNFLHLFHGEIIMWIELWLIQKKSQSHALKKKI